jgi:translation initiation factor 1A
MAKKKEELSVEEEIARTRIPQEGEILAVVTEMLGDGRMRVECDDGKIRIGRVIGKLRKRVWIRVGDLVLVKPWIVEGDRKCDIIHRYTPTQASWLKKKGYLKNIDVLVE